MGKNSGSVRQSNKKPQLSSYAVTKETINDVSRALQRYSKVDRWNNNTAYNLGFNSDAQKVVERLSEGNYGIATDIAKRAVLNPNWNKYGYNFSDKQAYVIAKAALENKLVHKSVIFDHNEASKPKKRGTSAEPFIKSSTKIAQGSKIIGSKGEGTITRIITKSSGYVEVTYSNGTVRKEMAFNLKGADGNYLKKKP